ncbi:hypothetical protein [Leptospira noguchii]|nr:hypothetical protein [Leptospira noguchii]
MNRSDFSIVLFSTGVGLIRGFRISPTSDIAQKAWPLLCDSANR